MEEYREKLEKMYQQLNEEEDPVLKKMVSIPYSSGDIIIYCNCFWFYIFKVSTDKSILDLFSFVAVGSLLVFGGIFLNYLLSKGR